MRVSTTVACNRGVFNSGTLGASRWRRHRFTLYQARCNPTPPRKQVRMQGALSGAAVCAWGTVHDAHARRVHARRRASAHTSRAHSVSQEGGPLCATSKGFVTIYAMTGTTYSYGPHAEQRLRISMPPRSEQQVDGCCARRAV